MKQKFSAIICKTPKWFIGFCPEVPGANGQGKTRSECLVDLTAAIELMLEVNREQIMKQMPSRVIEETVLTVG